jgi:hypothetical protein
MWICHMDVVDARPQDWSLPPFRFTEKDGYFYGRGTSDMKDEDAAAAASLIRLKDERFVPDRDIIVAFTADKEVGLEQDGPDYLLKHSHDLVDAGSVQASPETIPDPKVMASIAKVAHSMWPGVPLLPTLDAGASDTHLYARGGDSKLRRGRRLERPERSQNARP